MKPAPTTTVHRTPAFEVFVLAFAVILMEVSYTRIFSFKLVYYFAYLVIGIGLLGLGTGGIFVALVERLRRSRVADCILVCAAVAAASVALGYFLVAEIRLNLFLLARRFGEGDVHTILHEGGKLLLVCLVLTVPFLAAGIAFARIFARYSERIGRLYASDLLGAAAGCVLVVPALTWLSPPGTVFLSALCFAAAGVPLAFDRSRKLGIAVVAGAVGLGLVVAFASRLPDPIPDQIKGRGKRIESVFHRWHPVFRVDVMPLTMSSPLVHFLVHDGTPGSSLIEYDGNPESLSRYETNERGYPFRLLQPNPRVAIIGSAGGNEILASLHFGARSITGIELNPVTVSLLTDHFADFTGHLTSDPHVRLVNAEGRSFLAGSGESFDLVWLVAPDSYAAMNAATSGAFVLSESYLYTREMILAALAHLPEDGILCAQFGEIAFDAKPNRTLRYLGTARAALRELGIEDFGRHVLVAVSPAYRRLQTATVLVRKREFSLEEAERFASIATKPAGSRAAYAWGTAHDDGPVAAVVDLEGEELERFYDTHPYDVRPIDDDSPFFWNFVRFRDILTGSRDLELNVEEGIGERIAVALVCFSALFAAVLLALPLVAIRRVWSAIPYKLNAAVYFAALGFGFMFFEISLIQRFTLLLGYPTYSLTVTLFAILVSTGIGSLMSERWIGSRNRAFAVCAAALLALAVLYDAALPLLVRSGIGWPFPLRVVATVLLVAPLGIVLGCFMPFGMRSVAATTSHGQEYVAWCWAVNGFCSVVASVLATLLAMAFGFAVVMAIGVAVYLTGIAVFLRVPPPPATASA